MKKILTQAELACLLSVPTTVRMAKTILRRYQALLQLVRRGKSGGVKIGCPHCLKAGGTRERVGDCEKCTYPVLEGERLDDTRCLNYSFGYMTARDIVGIDLHADSIGFDDDAITADDQRRAVITWLEGHIEWAREVIHRGAR